MIAAVMITDNRWLSEKLTEISPAVWWWLVYHYYTTSESNVVSMILYTRFYGTQQQN
jgi:hypothetical protein